MGEPRPAAGVEPGLLAAGLAMALLLMAFGALATLGGALLLRLLSGIRIMTAISQAAAATFFILLMPAGVCRLIARIRGWDPAPEPDELGTRIVRIWGLESIDCDGNLPQRRLPSSDIECTVYRNDRRVHVTIHADDSNRLGLYDTDGKALKPVGKD